MSGLLVSNAYELHQLDYLLCTGIKLIQSLIICSAVLRNVDNAIETVSIRTNTKTHILKGRRERFSSDKLYLVACKFSSSICYKWWLQCGLKMLRFGI